MTRFQQASTLRVTLGEYLYGATQEQRVAAGRLLLKLDDAHVWPVEWRQSQAYVGDCNK